MCRIPQEFAGFPQGCSGSLRDVQDSPGMCRIPQGYSGFLLQDSLGTLSCFPGSGMDQWELCWAVLPSGMALSTVTLPLSPALPSSSSWGCARHREVTNEAVGDPREVAVPALGRAWTSRESPEQPWPSLADGKEPEEKLQWLLGLPSRAPCPGQGKSHGNGQTPSSKARLWSAHPAWSQGWLRALSCDSLDAQSSPGCDSLAGTELQERGDKDQQ